MTKQYPRLNRLLRKYQKTTADLARLESDLATAFSKIMRSSEKDIKYAIMEIFPKVREMEPKDADLQFQMLMDDTDRIVHSVFRDPIMFNEQGLWRPSDDSDIRRAIALSVIRSTGLAYMAAKFTFKDDIPQEQLNAMRMLQQKQMAQRYINMGNVLTASIRDWVYSEIISRLNRGMKSEIVQDEIQQSFSSESSVFRVAGVRPETRAGLVARNETRLSYLGAFAAIATMYIALNPEKKLYAQSVPIFDDRTGDDSIEAYELTKNWVGYPEPYMSSTDFRRRPYDRCSDVIATAEDLSADGIEPETPQAPEVK